MDIKIGDVLIDNTTAYGAYYAYEYKPNEFKHLITSSHAVNLRSLMDILEAIVLYDRLVLDASSRVTYGDSTSFENIWDLLSEAKDANGNDILEEYIFSLTLHNNNVPIINIALQNLIRHIKSSDWINTSIIFQKHQISDLLPTYYTSPIDFAKSILDSHKSYSSNESLLCNLKSIQEILDKLPPIESNYAMFAFRGYYYYEIANALNIPYSPHTWRTNIVKYITDEEDLNFAKHITRQAMTIRNDIAKTINSKFETSSLDCNLPVLSTYIAHQTEHRNKLIKTALEIRNSYSARTFRRWLKEIQRDIDTQSNLPKIRQAKNEVDYILNEMRKEFRLDKNDKNESLTVMFKTPVIPLEISKSFHLRAPTWLKCLFPTKPHLIFLREITRKSVSLSPFSQRYQQLEFN